ncbi:amino acid permease [Salmonella enterica subsp. diarizonae]|nr:amino acid permease [Salmonella enterica subsp. diarizonae]EAO8179637.1 amino acid permease [Salmonella enterica]EBV2375305.1 amino acid permease [Salmonella enterica subsp. enterica serovar Enteritidis]EGL0765142.1 amino acid permease [Salmonella enterica subsp. enterica]EAY1190094.1 amino acid permease [Salmonella enterica]
MAHFFITQEVSLVKCIENENSENNGNGLKRSLKSRHMLMISIGGTIGTGLFIGAGQVIHEAGPLGAVLAFIFGGLVMYLALLCLAELAVAIPVAGSFQVYANTFISPAVGFTVGWMYWITWVICIASNFTASAIITHTWFPAIPIWEWCLIFIVFTGVINSISVKIYGEMEFWFAGIKIVAIIAFIVSGVGFMLGYLGHEGAVGLENFSTDSGIFPNGYIALYFTLITVVFSFQGAELVGIASGECENPEINIPRVIKGVVFRIIIFYVLAIVVLGATIPYQQAGVLDSPFAYVFSRIGIPVAKIMMSVVVLTSALSASNSALYVCSRMLWSMSNSGQAPAWLGKVSKSGVPFRGLVLSLLFTAISLLTSFYAADTVYLWLVSSVGMTGCIAWIVISWCQINFREKYVNEGGDLKKLIFRTPLYPFIPWISIILNILIIVSLAFMSDQRIVLYTGIPGLLIIYGVYWLFFRKKNTPLV